MNDRAVIYYYYYILLLLLLCHLSLVLNQSYHQYAHLLLIHSGLGLIALGLGLGFGLDLVASASASYTSGLINIPGKEGIRDWERFN